MSYSRPTLAEWKDLYQAAAMFKDFAPWEWMEDSDILGVKDPESGEVGYCCILGAAGQLYGILVYLGSEGLSLFEGIQSGAISTEDEDLHTMQKCLALTFDDRDMLDKSDLAVIKDLGLKFRGRGVWPSFRSHQPGFAPYYLSGSEARFLDLALHYVMGVSERVRENENLLVPPKAGSYLVGSLSEENGHAWRDEWITPVPFVREAAIPRIDELRLARIRSQCRKTNQVWEIDCFFAPFIVEEGERPFFPYIALYAVHKERYVLGFVLAKYSEFPQVFLDNFLGTLEQIKVLPEEIIVRKDAVYNLFEPALRGLEVKLKMARSLKAIDHAKESLFRSMGG